jgi:hypothetical protein
MMRFFSCAPYFPVLNPHLPYRLAAMADALPGMVYIIFSGFPIRDLSYPHIVRRLLTCCGQGRLPVFQFDCGHLDS